MSHQLPDDIQRSPVLVRLQQVAAQYGSGAPIFTGIDLTVRRGEFVGIAGPNGGGKSTLLRTILERMPRQRGTVSIAPGTSIGWLRQRSQLGVEGPVTVRELVRSGAVRGGAWFGAGARRARRRAAEAISQVGLEGQERALVRTLSGGQQQRAFFAAVLASDPELLLLDEPTTGIDAESQQRLAEILRAMHAERAATILYVSHEFGVVENDLDRVVVVDRGIEFDDVPAAMTHDVRERVHWGHACAPASTSVEEQSQEQLL